MTPDDSLRNAMAANGLSPGTIAWDGKFHRFPSEGDKGRKKSGWYIAYPDPPESAGYGCWKHGISETWTNKGNGKSDAFDPEKWEAIKRLRKAEQAKRWKKAAKECKARWDKAEPASADHPYLKKKGITNTEGIKQEGNLLLVPMKSFERGFPITSLQTIDAKGVKLFAEGGKVAGSRTTIGHKTFAEGGKVYITEGWATGASIHEATDAPVIVAFSAGNLLEVTESLVQRLPTAKLILASDNDRWTSIPKGTNPGVIAAREVGSETGIQIAIPDFLDLDGKPTDFNDLMQAEGAGAVRHWLTKSMANKARTTEQEEAPTEEWGGTVEETSPETATEPPVEYEDWTAKAPFRCLGYDRGTYFYLPKGTGQIHHLTPQGHDRKSFLPLAPLVWWEETFSSKKGADWTTAADALMRGSERRGVFNLELLRGRGCWPVDGDDGKEGFVLHLGDRLLPPGGGGFVEPEEYKCPEGRIYERLKKKVGPSESRAIPLEEAQSILALFKDLLWFDPASGVMAAGWTALAPIAGILPWRPHIWITGGTGSGKSTILKRLLQPLMADMSFHFEGGSTEAGIRQRIRADSLPVLYDEAERSDSKSDHRLQSILGLARGASSTGGEAETAKGTPSGTVLSFHINSMFCLASIGGTIKQEADKTRFSLLQLKSKSNLAAGEKAAHWREYGPRLNKISTKVGRELMARTLSWVRDGRLEATLEVFRDAATAVLGDPRFGDQYGTIYAGAWTLMSDTPPEPIEAKELLGGEDLEHYIEDQAPEGMKALQVLLQSEERVDTTSGMKNVSVGQLVGISAGEMGSDGGVSKDDAERKLKALGMKIQVFGGEQMLCVANQSQWITKALKDTPYGNISVALRTLPETQPTDAIRFHQGFSSRCTAIPLKILDG